MPRKVTTSRAVDEFYDDLGGRPSFNDRLAIFLANGLGSMTFFYVCVVLDLIELGPVIQSGSVIVWCTYLSQTVIQLIALPILAVQQKVMTKHHEAHGKKLDKILDNHRGLSHQLEHLEPVPEVPHEVIKKMLEEDPLPRSTKPYNRQALIAALIDNRSKQQKGSGQKYWESVAMVVEKRLGLHPQYE